MGCKNYTVTRLLIVVLSLQLSFAPVFVPSVARADAAKSESAQTSQQSTVQYPAEVTSSPEDMPDELTSVVSEVSEVYAKFFKIRQAALESIGHDALVKELQSLSDEDLAKKGYLTDEGNLSTIDGNIIIRVIHQGTDTAWIFINKNLLNERPMFGSVYGKSFSLEEDSSHFKKYIARQHVYTNKNAKDRFQGRDVVVAWVDESDDGDVAMPTNADLVSYPREKGFKGFFKDYIPATFAKPTVEDVWTAVFFTAAQVVMTTGLNIINNFHSLTSGTTALVPFLANAVNSPLTHNAMFFGMLIGINISTYKNWADSGSKLDMQKKAMGLTLVSNYAIMAGTGGWHSLSFVTTAGLLANAAIWRNALMSTWVKVEAGQIARWRKQYLRTSAQRMAGMKRSNFENQALNLVNSALNKGALVHVPVLKECFWVSKFLWFYANLKYAEHMRFPTAKRERAKWDNFKQKFKDIASIKIDLETMQTAVDNSMRRLFGNTPVMGAEKKDDTPLAAVAPPSRKLFEGSCGKFLSNGPVTVSLPTR